jgi:hypothetical protein
MNYANDMKLYMVNLLTIGFTMTKISDALSIILLLITIGFTANRWYVLNETKKKNNK